LRVSSAGIVGIFARNPARQKRETLETVAVFSILGNKKTAPGRERFLQTVASA